MKKLLVWNCFDCFRVTELKPLEEGIEIPEHRVSPCDYCEKRTNQISKVTEDRLWV